MKKLIKWEQNEDKIIYSQRGSTPEEVDEKIFKEMAINIIHNMEMDDLKKIFSMRKEKNNFSARIIKFVVKLEV